MNNNSVKMLIVLWAVAATLQGCGQNKVAPVATQVNEEYLEEASLVEIAPVEECTDEPVVDLHPYDFTLCFAGDIKFDETEENMQYLSSCENGIYDCIDSKLMEALEDTFETLEEAGIPYVGAGRSLKEAMQPVYFDVEGKKNSLCGSFQSREK